MMSIVCSSVSRNTKLYIDMVAPTAVEGVLVTVKPEFVVARPVAGLKVLPPALYVVRICDISAERPSVETTLSSATTRLNVTLRLRGVVLVTVTACVALKVSRTFSDV